MADELQTKRIIDLAQKTGPEAGDNLAVDNATSGTRRILWANLLDENLSDNNKAAPAGTTRQAIEDARTTFTDLGDGNIAVNYDEDVPAGTETPLQSIRFPLLPYKYTVPVIDPTFTQSGQAADAKETGDKIEGLRDTIGEIITTNVLYKAETKTVSGTGTYVFEEILTIENPVAGTVYNFEIGEVSGTSQTWVGVLQVFDTNNVRTDYSLRQTTKKITYTTLNTDVKLVFLLYPSSSGAVTATYTDVIIYTGSTPDLTFTEEAKESIGKIANESVAEEQFVDSRNIFASVWEHNTYNSNGEYIPSSATSVTASPPDIPIVGGNVYTVSFGTSDAETSINYYIHEFDSDGNRLVYKTFTSRSYTFKAEPNATALGFSIYSPGNTEWTNLIPKWTQVETGAVKTPYVNHSVVKNENIDSYSLINANANELNKIIFMGTQNFTVKTVAHRGDDIDAPQCVEPAYIIAKMNGNTIAENDLWLSEDDELVMWHDTTLYRLGNLVDINGYSMYTDGTDFYYVDGSNVYTWNGTDYVASSVALSSLTRCAGENYGVNSTYASIGLPLDVLKRIDFGVYKSIEFAGTQILTFEEWVMLCKKLGLEMYVDNKLTYTENLITKAANIVKKCGMGKYTSWLGVPVDLIGVLRSIIPDARCGTLAHPTTALVEAYAPYNTGRGFFFDGDANTMTAEAIQIGLNAGFDVEVWYVGYVNTTEETIFEKIREAVSYGVTAMTLDHYRVSDAFSYLYNNYR